MGWFWAFGGKLMDDELDKLKPAGMTGDMQRWNIEDLEAYIHAMRVEIENVEKILASKKLVNSAAAALFGKQGD